MAYDQDRDRRQAQPEAQAQAGEADGEAAAADRTKFTSAGAKPAVGTGWAPRRATDTDAAYGNTDQTQAVANAGVAGPGGALPYQDQIQRSFGRHDISNVQAHTGGQAAAASNELGAQAYATGDQVAFGGAPSLHTAAHEAAHIVQQRGGVQLKGGVGAAGDPYEQNADAVADRVVQGKPAEDLLDPVAAQGGNAGSKAVQSKGVQFLGHKLGTPLPAGEEAPAYGEDVDQRRYSVEQYQAMWEKEQEHKLSGGEKDTIARGCIGITANNVSGGGNPPLENAFGTFEQAHKYQEGRNKELHEMRADPKQAAKAPKGEYILFAKLFWSNQNADPDKRKDHDDTAYKPDPKTGRVDMHDYKYRAQPGYVNFDYGFWDEASQCFWHANHSQPDMKVYQSTKDHFVRGYIDFDRIIFCVALAQNYDPGKAAMDSARNGGGGG
jgi:hypothetical protein